MTSLHKLLTVKLKLMVIEDKVIINQMALSAPNRVRASRH